MENGLAARRRSPPTARCASTISRAAASSRTRSVSRTRTTSAISTRRRFATARPVASARRVQRRASRSAPRRDRHQLCAAWRAASRVGGTMHAVRHPRRERAVRARSRRRDRTARPIIGCACVSRRAWRRARRSPTPRSVRSCARRSRSRRRSRAWSTSCPTAPLHRWVARFTPTAGATVFSDGLAEYESLPDGAVAVTLVRAVGALSRVDLPERPGHAGWPADTPLAQCIGPFERRARARAARPDDSGAARRDRAAGGRRPASARRRDAALQPRRAACVRAASSSLGDGLAFSAACPAREHGWIVLRCVNRRDVAVAGAGASRAPSPRRRSRGWTRRRISPLVVRDRVDRVRGAAARDRDGARALGGAA